MRNEKFLEFLEKYCFEKVNVVDGHLGETVDLVETKFLIAELYRYSLSIENNYYSDEIVKAYKKAKKAKDYKTMADLIYTEFTTAYLPITLKWKEHPELLSRHFMVPLRFTMADLIVACLASIRADGSHLASIENKYIKFDMYDEEDSSLYERRDVYSAIDVLVADFASDTAAFNLVYDYGEDWEFSITRRKIKHIKDEELNTLPIILEKAKGYGIFEDNKGLLLDAIENPNGICEFDEDSTNLEFIPFDFYDACFEELQDTIVDEFDMLFNMYHDDLYDFGDDEDFDDSYDEEEYDNDFEEEYDESLNEFDKEFTEDDSKLIN